MTILEELWYNTFITVLFYFMNTNPFTALDKVKTAISLNEAYDKELKAIQERRSMVWSWKNEQNKIKRERDKKRYKGYE